MSTALENIQNFIEQNSNLLPEQKEALIKSLKEVSRELEIVKFKLDRTEKVKRTTAILLEETIEELEQKRLMVEESKSALEQSLEELKATQAQLIHSEKMASLGELTAGIAHEIQNPLNFVNNFSEVSVELIEEMIEEAANEDLEEVKAISEDLKQNLSKISHHGKRAESIVKGMLMHSRVSKGEKILTDINALGEEYLRLSYHGLRAKNRNFNVGFEMHFDDIPKVEIVPQDIGRVLLNLFNNAFQACADFSKSMGGLQAEECVVTLSTIDRGDKIEISVKDNGPGIPEETKDKIFQPFFTTKPTGQGTGLGLSIAYDIIKAHGGEIKLFSQIGEGTEFKIILPL